MQYILNESEYAALQSRINELESVNHDLVVSLTKANHRLDVADQVRETDRQQLADLATENQTYCDQIAECKRDTLGMEKRISDLSDQLAYFRGLASDRYDRLGKIEAERNALKESLAKAQRRIEHSEHLSERRLRLANELQTEVQRLKHESVAIVLSPSKRYRAVSLGKVGTYERFGWVVLDEGYAVDRTA